MMRMLTRAVATLFALGLFGQDASRAIAVKPSVFRPREHEARVALVIGNGGYGEAPLRNPVNDAVAMKDALEASKFQVTLLTDASKRAMEDAIRAFGDQLRGGAVGLFYFAGHGIQAQGSNFLIPVGAHLEKETDVAYEGVDVGRVLDNMQAAGNKLNIVILDACRNNPFAQAQGWRTGGGQGLAQVKAPTGSLVAYATAPGSTAADGPREHGLYTEVLLAEMREPGLTLLQTFQKVRERVLEGSKGGQTPWESNSTVGDFYFIPLVTNLAGPTQAELEATVWEGVKDTVKARDLEDFLLRFPAGVHAELANAKLANVRRASANVIVNNLAEPWKALQPDALETKREYAERVAALGALKVGTAKVRVEDYDVETGSLAVVVEPMPWARPYLGTRRGVVQMDRGVLRQVLAAEEAATAVTTFVVQDGRPQPVGMSLMTPSGALLLGPERPPIPGATRNAQGLWEVDLSLGACRLRMVAIPPGTFLMGEAANPHEVTLSKEFWMGKYPVTQAQWEAVMGNNPANFRGPDLPVENVSWNGCQPFLSALNVQTHWAVRLPTEAEWEYACRAGTTDVNYGPLDAIAWYAGNSGKTTHPVGQKEANAFGLHDMNGNVWQWCQDWYGDYPAEAVTDPQGPFEGQERVRRGGAYNYPPAGVRSGGRAQSGSLDNRFSFVGLRVVAVARTQ